MSVISGSSGTWVSSALPASQNASKSAGSVCVGGVSPESPLGRALLGAAVGDTVEVEAPRGAWQARVIAIAR